MSLARYQDLALAAIAAIAIAGASCRSSSAARRSMSMRSSKAGGFRAYLPIPLPRRTRSRGRIGGIPSARRHGCARSIPRRPSDAAEPAPHHSRPGDLRGDRHPDVGPGGQGSRRRIDALEIGLTMPRDALSRSGRPGARSDRARARRRGAVAARGRRSGERPGHEQPRLPPARSRICGGESSLEQAIERIRLDTHRYVRHQETWLRRNPAADLVRRDATRLARPQPWRKCAHFFERTAAPRQPTSGADRQSGPTGGSYTSRRVASPHGGRATRKGPRWTARRTSNTSSIISEPPEQGPHGGCRRPARRRQSRLRRPHHHVCQDR